MKQNSSKRRKSQGIDQLPSGRWRWRVTVGYRPSGSPISLSGTAETEKAAYEARVKTLADHLRGGSVQPERITTAEWLERWLNGKKFNLAAKTVENYTQIIRRHINPRLGKTNLQNLKPIDLQGLYTSMTERGLVDTQRQAHNILHAALDEALRLDLIVRNPSKVIRPRPPRRDQKSRAEAKALSAEEVQKLLPVLREDRWGIIFEFMLATGLRRAEVCGLRWEDIDMDARRLRFEQTLVTVAGKPVEGPAKTVTRERMLLHLSQDAMNCLQRQEEQQELERTALGPGPVKGHSKELYHRKRVWQRTGYVFTALYGTRLHPDRLRKHLRRLSDKAGVRATTNHGLRHTHASLMLRRGVPLEVVSKKLGHARPSFTADVYRHVYDDEFEEWTLDLVEMLERKKR